MKLRDKLKISFCVMIILPVIMLCVFVVGISNAVRQHMQDI